MMILASKLPKNPIPFLVADRQKSLELLKHSEIHKQKFPVGLMGNANSTPNFREAFRKFRGKNIIKITDSGIFTKDGGLSKNYNELFDKYEKMETDYGIILDVIKNKRKTIASAKNAIKEYRKKKRSFKLIGVAQGKTIHEYLECYGALKRMESVVSVIRKKYPKDWLFLLGSFHPKRFSLLKKYKIFGADFKGWIFNYNNPSAKRAISLRRLRRIEIQNNIRDRKLTNLFKSNYQFIDLEEENDWKRISDIIKTRKKIARKLKNEEYDKNLEELIYVTESNDDELRERRFEDVKKFIHKKIFSCMHPKKLLIVGCSQKKKDFVNLTPAIELYDGPTFRMLRKYKPIYYNGVDVMIISAKYGLMNHNHLIYNYDQRLTKEQVPLLKMKTKERLSKQLQESNYNEIMLSMGKDYLQLFDGIEKFKPKYKIKIAKGKIGEKLHHTKRWLEKNN